jgi:hypothetical protein
MYIRVPTNRLHATATKCRHTYISCSFHTFYMDSPHTVDASGHHTLIVAARLWPTRHYTPLAIPHPFLTSVNLFKFIIIIRLLMSSLLTQAFLMDYTLGERPITRAQCGLVGTNDCKCSREQRLNMPSESRRST